MGTYTKSWTNRAPRPRSERLRRIGGFAGSVLAPASPGSDIPSSAPDWFLPMTLGEETYLLLNPKYVGLAADGWMAAGGVGQDSSGGGTYVQWGTPSGNTVPLIVEGDEKSLVLATALQILAEKSWVQGLGYLVSGDLVTINQQSLVGSGDITITNGVDGESAYDLWLDEGNVGTVQDFLASLKGDTGVSADHPITIYNGLDSSATDQALSALQGKLLDQRLTSTQKTADGNRGSLDKIESDFYTDGDAISGGTATYGYIDTDGAIHSSDEFMYRDYDVSNAFIVDVACRINGGGVVSAITGYDANGNFVKSYAVGTSGSSTVERSARIDCVGDGVATIRICNNDFITDAPVVRELESVLAQIAQETIPAIQDEIDALYDDLYAAGEEITGTTTSGYYIKLNGDPEANGDFFYNTYDVSGESLVVAEARIQGGGVVSVITGYDSNGNFVKSYGQGPGGTASQDFSEKIDCVADGISTIRISTNDYNSGRVKLSVLQSQSKYLAEEVIPDIEDKIDDLTRAMYHPGDILPVASSETGKYVAVNGSLNTASGWMYKQYNVSGIVYAKVVINSGSGVSVITGYDSNGNFVQSFALGTIDQTVLREAVIDCDTLGIAMIRLCTNSDRASTANLYEGVTGEQETPDLVQTWGDSITYQGQFQPGIAEVLGIPDGNVKNAGIGSDFSMHVRRRFVSYFTDATPYVGTGTYSVPSFSDRQIELNKSFFVFWMGTNNLLNWGGRAHAFTDEDTTGAYQALQPNPDFRYDKMYSRSYIDMMLSDIKQMVGILPHGNFAIIGGHGGFMEAGDARDAMLELDGILARMYPRNFIDVRELVVMDYDYQDVHLTANFTKPALNGSVSIQMNKTSWIGGTNTNPGWYICIGTKQIYDKYQVTNVNNSTTVTAKLVESNTEWAHGDTIRYEYLLVSDLGRDAVNMPTRVFAYEDCVTFSLMSFPRSSSDPIHFTSDQYRRIGQLIAYEIKKMKLN